MVVEVENISWFSRIMDSIKGVLFGLLLFVVSFPVLFWNEGRAVKRAKDLEEGRGAVIEASLEDIDASQDGKLVHLSGRAETEATLRDPELGVTAEALRLKRTVEMYQWLEDSETRTKKKVGGGKKKVTEYTYRQDWSANWADSSGFKEVEGHQNPPMPYRNVAVDADDVTLGDRKLSSRLIAQIGGFGPFPVTKDRVTGLGESKRPLHESQGGIYVGQDPNQPKVGDLRIRWQTAPEAEISVLAAQAGDSFSAWTTPSGRTLEQNLEMGTVSASDMFGRLEAENETLTWILRIAGFFAMFLGISLVLRPFSVVADVLPILGSLVGAGAAIAALVLSVPLSLITIATGWIVYRPLIGAALLAVGLAFGVGVGALARRRGKAKNAARAVARAEG